MTLSCAVAMAQNKVTGTVIDDKGDPINWSHRACEWLKGRHSH